MLMVKECKRDNLCVDCDDSECLHAGEIGADCPKWHCDNDKPLDCENCTFIKFYVNDVRSIK